MTIFSLVSSSSSRRSLPQDGWNLAQLPQSTGEILVCKPLSRLSLVTKFLYNRICGAGRIRFHNFNRIRFGIFIRVIARQYSIQSFIGAKWSRAGSIYVSSDVCHLSPLSIEQLFSLCPLLNVGRNYRSTESRFVTSLASMQPALRSLQ